MLSLAKSLIRTLQSWVADLAEANDAFRCEPFLGVVCASIVDQDVEWPLLLLVLGSKISADTSTFLEWLL